MKKAIENIFNVLPDFIKNAGEYLKDNFDENGKDIIGDASGTAAAITKLLAQPLLNKYFSDLSDKKLENFGLNVYWRAALIQANESIEVIKEHLNNELDAEIILGRLEKSITKEFDNFNASDILLIYKPKYHPVVVFVKNTYERALKQLDTTPNHIKSFIKHFNENIDTQITNEFGTDYKKHLVDAEDLRLKDAETDLLWDMTRLGRIGLRESESLKYEETFAKWKRVSKLREKEEEVSDKKAHLEQENKLQPIENLIEEYFNFEPDNHLEKILFIVADFGKGKSVFLRHSASKLAREYLTSGEGFFPIYFNLRNFNNYSSETKLGVISDYLETKYSFKIDDKDYENNNYVFLIDSLDESGELNKANIDNVISSIKKIQAIDKTKYKTNRIIITSRPFDEGFTEHLNSHKPHIIKNEENREILHFISMYGFKKDQFNDWLLESLKSFKKLDNIEASGLTKTIIESINNNEPIDIYEQLVKNNILSSSELRRPIFAYMIYQLIVNNVDFAAIGKIGIYLSFINLLTKDAKHINDPNYPIDLKKEFEYRNILHATAALWMYERQKGKQGSLKKADICRVLDGENTGESDKHILEKYENKGVTEIQFLSHSYFGENDNILHFQHQSFAEILLAEYYLKVFIKYALDEDLRIEEARTKLILGEPTEQTIQFLKEMLLLMRDTAINETNDEIIEKRKLLFPLMSSLSTKQNNTLFCHDLFYSWYKQYDIPENHSNIPIQLLENWCINKDNINKIIKLAKAILESSTNYMLTKADIKTSLFNKELLAVQNKKLNSLPPDMDRWLALLVGNSLYNDIDDEKFFNTTIINIEHLFDLIKNWNYSFNTSSPPWGNILFKGINMQSNNKIILSDKNLSCLDFSYSKFHNIVFDDSNLSACKFIKNTFDNVEFIHCKLQFTTITQIQSIKNLTIGRILLQNDIYLPTDLTNLYHQLHSKGQYLYIGNSVTVFGKDANSHDCDAVFNTLEGLLTYGLKHKLLTIKKIKSWFHFEGVNFEDYFFKKIDELKKYEHENVTVRINRNIIKH